MILCRKKAGNLVTTKGSVNANLNLIKLPDENGDVETTNIQANSFMTLVAIDGFGDEQFLEKVEQSLNAFASFSSEASGCILDSIEKLVVKVAKYRPTKGSSFIHLPVELQQNRFVLNIRNTRDHNCFLYCFIAAHHLKYEPLLAEGRDSANVWTDPATYSFASNRIFLN